ncbi:hypothetical protein BZP36_09290 [Raoultella terrigena]|nr:hypothetical protein BZP36_09290 [Raoultella terrigena]
MKVNIYINAQIRQPILETFSHLIIPLLITMHVFTFRFLRGDNRIMMIKRSKINTLKPKQ